MIDKKELKEAQKIMLEILKEVDRICRKHKIKYWLDGGTLLGAVRHKGFIPWDDDIDISMLPEDYTNFIKIALKELSKKYFLDNKETDPYIIFKYLKIRDKNSIFIEKEEEEEKYHQGIFIDIFLMNHLNNSSISRRKLYNILLKFKDLIVERGKYKFLKLILKKFGIVFLSTKLFDFLFLNVKEERKIIGYKYNFNQIYFLKDIFPLKEIEFEETMFYCPSNFDAILKELYGDTYMELPPKDQRVWHAKEIKFNQKCIFERNQRGEKE
ncbi:LicD family protein [Fusobacterium sp. THCT13E1]